MTRTGRPSVPFPFLDGRGTSPLPPPPPVRPNSRRVSPTPAISSALHVDAGEAGSGPPRRRLHPFGLDERVGNSPVRHTGSRPRAQPWPSRRPLRVPCPWDAKERSMCACHAPEPRPGASSCVSQPPWRRLPPSRHRSRCVSYDPMQWERKTRRDAGRGWKLVEFEIRKNGDVASDEKPSDAVLRNGGRRGEANDRSGRNKS
eukprot:scaffold625_cov324-Pavlova_lutheri.AAC.94